MTFPGQMFIARGGDVLYSSIPIMADHPNPLWREGPEPAPAKYQTRRFTQGCQFGLFDAHFKKLESYDQS